MKLDHIALLAIFFIPLSSRAELPKGWYAGGFHHEGGYEVVVDKDPHQTGWALLIRSTPQWKEGESNTGTAFKAEPYRGKRVRFSAMLKTEQVASFAGLWFQVTGATEGGEKPKIVRFDNMHERAPKGTTGWSRFSIVQDVPANGKLINIGSYLVGPGKIWMSQPTFEEVGTDVPVTSSGAAPGAQLPDSPQLDFGLR